MKVDIDKDGFKDETSKFSYNDGNESFNDDLLMWWLNCINTK